MPNLSSPTMTRRTFLGASTLAVLGASALSLTACGGSDGIAGSGDAVSKRVFVPAEAGTYAGAGVGSPWVSSNLAHNVGDGFAPAATEDFYGYANADWFKDQQVPQGTHSYRPAIDDAEYEVRCRLREVLASEDDTTSFDIDEAQTAARNYYALLTSWEDRDEAGYRGLEIALNEVSFQSSLEDFVTYLFSSGRLTWLTPLVDFVPVRDPRDANHILLSPRPMIFDIHHSAAATLEDTAEAKAREDAWVAETTWLLQKTAFASEADSLVQASIALQKEFAATVVAAPKPTDSQRVVTRDEFAEIMRGFPLDAIEFSYGIEELGDILISASAEQYCSCLRTIFDAGHLEGIKAQIMCALTHAGYDFLTKEAYEHLHGEIAEDTLLDLAAEEVLSTMRGPVTALYEERYADEETKAALDQLVDDVRGGLKATIEENEWMQASTKSALTSKLDDITVVTMFPSYEDLGFAPDIDRARDGGYAWAAKRQAEIYRRTLVADALTASVPADYMQEAQTLTSHYSPSFLDARVTFDQVGALQVGAGLACGVFDATQSREEQLARAGVLIAHELTHAIDARGWNRDASGRSLQLYDSQDTLGLSERTAVVASWFDSACLPLDAPVAGYGERVKIEAIAEMCALKALTKVAESEGSFDYKKFFEEYAHFMRDIQEQGLFEETIATSASPLAATRVNLAVGSLPIFRETFGVAATDTMATADTEGLSVF